MGDGFELVNAQKGIVRAFVEKFAGRLGESSWYGAEGGYDFLFDAGA